MMLQDPQETRETWLDITALYDTYCSILGDKMEYISEDDRM